MAIAERPFRLAVLGLTLLHLLSTATAEDNLVLRCHAVVATTELRASDLPNDAMLTGAGRAATSTSITAPRHVHSSAAAREDTTTTPRRFDSSVTAREDATAPATATATPPPSRSSCRCVCVVVRLREAAVDDILPAPSGITTTAATTATKKVLLHALPLLAVPFLPPLLAALVVLSSLAPSACASDDTCPLIPPATCTVYLPFADGTGFVDRFRPINVVRPVVGGARHGRLDYPFLRYWHVRTVDFFRRPEGGVVIRVLDDHPPVADPDAVVAAGGDVCYVELAHMNYRQGNYIICPVRKWLRFPFLHCSDRPSYTVVGERRTLTYLGKYGNGTSIHAQAW